MRAWFKDKEEGDCKYPDCRRDCDCDPGGEGGERARGPEGAVVNAVGKRVRDTDGGLVSEVGSPGRAVPNKYTDPNFPPTAAPRDPED